MPDTLKPGLRVEILDELLNRRWTGIELLKQVNERLLSRDERPIDNRTLLRDLKYLLEKRHAPLHRPKDGGKYYYYTEKFSLKDIPLDSDELSSLKQAVSILKKVENFQLTKELDLIIGKLENRIHTNIPDNNSVVQFEDHTHAKGSNWFSELFDAIRESTTITVTYQPYNQSKPQEYIVHPYLLKEYRNRWFLLGRNDKSTRILTLGLDRIKRIKVSKETFLENDLFHPDAIFDKVIGVSIDYNSKPEEIILNIKPVSVPHVESKPIHKHQELLKRHKDGSITIKLNLIINYELKATLLGFGDGLEVISPPLLRAHTKKSLAVAEGFYSK